jgi:hypothetical protein
MTLPRSLHVNGRTIRLIPKPAAKLPDCYGQWREAGGKIDYRTRLSPIDKRDTILHELMHAIRSTQGREYGGEVEEDYVRSLATGLIGVFDDNPEFAKWLITHK